MGVAAGLRDIRWQLRALRADVRDMEEKGKTGSSFEL